MTQDAEWAEVRLEYRGQVAGVRVNMTEASPEDAGKRIGQMVTRTLELIEEGVSFWKSDA